MAQKNDVMTAPGVFLETHAKSPVAGGPPRLVVKVQAPLNNPNGDYLIYDEHRTFELGTQPSPELKHRMRGAAKKYFYARLAGPWDDRKLSLDDDAPEQAW